MSNILDEGSYGNNASGFQHDKLQTEQLATIGSRSRLVGIFTIIVQSFMVLGGVALLAIPSRAWEEAMREREVRQALEAAGIGDVDLGSLMGWVGAGLLIFAAISIFATTKLLQFGNGLQSYAKTGAGRALEDATAARKTYFMISAVLAALGLLSTLYFMFAFS